MSKKLSITITLLILANLTFAQTTNRGLVLETITDPETTLGQPEIKFQNYGNNAIEIKLSPNGNYIVISHGLNLSLLDFETGKILKRFIGHTDNVWSVNFSPDGKYLASGSNDGTVKLWNIETGKEIRTLTGHTDDVYSVSFSPDGKYLAGKSYGKSVKVWDVESGKEKITFSGYTGYVGSVSFTPDGKYLASGSNDGAIKLWEVESGKEIRTFSGHTDDVRSVRFSPDGKYIASGSDDDIVKLWEVESGKEIRTFSGHTDDVRSVSFSPDGKYLASRSNDGTVKLWEVANTKEKKSIWGEGVYFHSDGKYITVKNWDDQKIEVWELESVSIKNSFSICNSEYMLGDDFYYSEIYDFDYDGKYIATFNEGDGLLKVWDVMAGNVVKIFNSSTSIVKSVCFSPDGKYIASVNKDDFIKVCDVASGKVEKEYYGCSVDFSPDGKYLAIGCEDGSVSFWEVESGKEVRSFKGHTDDVNSVSFSPDGKYLASGSDDYTVKLWEVESGKDIKEISVFDDYSSGVGPVCFSPDGKYITIDLGNEVKLWEISSGIIKNEFPGRDASFTPDGKSIVGLNSTDSPFYLIILDVESGKYKIAFSSQDCFAFRAGLSSNGKYIAVCDVKNKISLIDVDSGNIIRSLMNHTDQISCVNFSPDGQYLVSGGVDGTVKLWDVETGELIYTIINGKDGEWLTYTPEVFFTGSEWATKNLVHIVDGLEVIGIDQVYDKLYRPDLVAAKMRGEDISMYAKEVNLASLVRSGSVPVVTLENLPENPTSRDITFDVCVKNTGGGIGKVNLVLNGKTIQLSEGVFSSTGQTVNFRHTITLQNGENTIEAFAYNGSGLVESRRPSSIISWEGKTTKPNLYVLTLAINKYRDKSLWLNYCVPDANAIAESFKSQESGLYENVYVSSLQDGEVTKEGISEEFKRLSNLVTADDVFVFYISGHGTTYDDGDYYYLPVNIRYTSREEIPIQGISKNDLIENLSLIKAGKTLLMLDTCNSGAFFADSGQRGLSEKTAIDRLTRATGHATLAASSDSQSAMEGYEGHGVFTYVLLEGLKGEADSNDDGFVTLLELASYVENEVPERSYEKWGYEQVPQKDLRRQDFPIALK